MSEGNGKLLMEFVRCKRMEWKRIGFGYSNDPLTRDSRDVNRFV